MVTTLDAHRYLIRVPVKLKTTPPSVVARLYPAVRTLELKTLGLTTMPLVENYMRFSDNPVLLGTGVSVPFRWRDAGAAGR